MVDTLMELLAAVCQGFLMAVSASDIAYKQEKVYVLPCLSPVAQVT